MVALKMDGTVRKARAPKRSTKELPFFVELMFVDGFKEAVAGKSSREPENKAYAAGYEAGTASACSKAAFLKLQSFAAANGYHRD
jgi:hypothetical protein